MFLITNENSTEQNLLWGQNSEVDPNKRNDVIVKSSIRSSIIEMKISYCFKYG